MLICIHRIALELAHFVFFTFFVSALLVQTATADIILVNKPASDKDKRYDYPHQLLQMIVDETKKIIPKLASKLPSM
jgi:hypothetical protein